MIAEYGAGNAEAKKTQHILRKMRKELFCETKINEWKLLEWIKEEVHTPARGGWPEILLSTCICRSSCCAAQSVIVKISSHSAVICLLNKLHTTLRPQPGLFVTYWNGWHRWIFYLEGSVYSFGHCFRWLPKTCRFYSFRKRWDILEEDQRNCGRYFKRLGQQCN